MIHFWRSWSAGALLEQYLRFNCDSRVLCTVYGCCKGRKLDMKFPAPAGSVPKKARMTQDSVINQWRGQFNALVVIAQVTPVSVVRPTSD